MKRFGIIVDGYSTGAGLAKEFLKYGISCIHVQSQRQIPKVYQHTYIAEDYDDHFIHDEDIHGLVNTLKKYKPEFIVSGAECGIELADELCVLLELPGNGTELSAHRRNKNLMYQQIEFNNLAVIPFICAYSKEEAFSWASKQSIWRLVVKPLNSAGGEGVAFCNDIHEVMKAYDNIISTKNNMLGFLNQGVLLQHFIQGEEFVVNLVSHDGKHKLCELWTYSHYQRSANCKIYDFAKIESYNESYHKDILDYAIKAVDALGIKYGPSHVEIIKSENGCHLVEVGARLMGANLPFTLLSECISTPQSKYTAMAYAMPERFNNELDMLYCVKKSLVAVFLIANQKGKVSSINNIEQIKNLDSYYDMNLATNIGETIDITIDYKTSPGMVYFSHEDPASIDMDVKELRVIEEKMFTLDKESKAYATAEL